MKNPHEVKAAKGALAALDSHVNLLESRIRRARKAQADLNVALEVLRMVAEKHRPEALRDIKRLSDKAASIVLDLL